jgi:ornithine racemase
MRIEVDCERIRANAQAVVRLAAKSEIEIAGVTKACCGHPEVAHAMLAGGVRLLAESRLGNVRRLRQAGITADVLFLRLPRLSEAGPTVELTQYSLNSELVTIRALSAAAQARGLVHRVLLMLETGDRREGMMPSEALGVAREVLELPGVELVGMSANVGCIGGVIPTLENTRLLVETAAEVEQALGIRLSILSGGHTASLGLIERNEMPYRVTQLRVGEGILLGVDSSSNWPLTVPYRDAFQVVAEVIEVQGKPSMPDGVVTVDAFGRKPVWEDLGWRQRAVLAMGEQDLRIGGLRPKLAGVTIVGASSDHTVVDVTDAAAAVKLGDEMAFAPEYSAVATAMASGDVEKLVRPIKERAHV